MNKTPLLLGALLALVSCADEDALPQPDSPEAAFVPEGYTEEDGASFPDFDRVDGRIDGTYALDCADTLGVHAFACAEQLFWQAVQFEPQARLEAHVTLSALIDRLEATEGSLDSHRLALLHWRKAQLTLMLVSEHEERSTLASALDALQRAHALEPDHVPIQSWLDTFEVTVAVAGAQAVGMPVDPAFGVDDKLRITEENAAEDFTAFYNFIITASAMPAASGWPDAAADLVESLSDEYSGAGAGFNVALRAPFVAQGVHITYGEVLARAGRKEQALAQLETALAMPGSDVWPYRSHAQDMVDQIDAMIGEFEALGPDQGAFFKLRILGDMGCSMCHMPEGQPPVPR